MPRDPFQLSSVVMSQYSKKNFLEKGSGRSPESFPESLPIWVKDLSLSPNEKKVAGRQNYNNLHCSIFNWDKSKCQLEYFSELIDFLLGKLFK